MLRAEETVLPPPEKDHPFRLESRHLIDDLGPDRPARASDQDDLVLQVPGDLVQIELDRLAAQQVFHVDLAELRDEDLVCEDLVEPR